MLESNLDPNASVFLQSIGLPRVNLHHPFNHFDFSKEGRRILVIGPMGSGKTEYSSRVWRDSLVARTKSALRGRATTTNGADRRQVFFIRSSLDRGRFPEYPDDALAYRGGYERLGERIAFIRDSFELEAVIRRHPTVGTWIIDEASFYDERLAYVVRRESEENGRTFIFPTLILNFRREIFNATARLILDTCTDVFPLTAYCEHPDCLADAFFTYRHYQVDAEECPALFFDPLIVIGGDRLKDDPREPNYCSRCEEHHYLPGKEYTFLVLKPLGHEAARGNLEPLEGELRLIKDDIQSSALAQNFREKYCRGTEVHEANLRSLKVPCIAEKVLLYLLSETNLVSVEQAGRLVAGLDLDRGYLEKRLADCGRPAIF
jgi:thymidine kinase